MSPENSQNIKTQFSPPEHSGSPQNSQLPKQHEPQTNVPNTNTNSNSVGSLHNVPTDQQTSTVNRSINQPANDKVKETSTWNKIPKMSSSKSAGFSGPQTNEAKPSDSSDINFGMGSFKIDQESKESVPVVKVWSVRGVEYAIMSFMLWSIAISVTWVIVSLINGLSGFGALSPPLALLIVSLPFFAVFFLRLKKAELIQPELKTESTKRRFSQITQIVSFAVIFFSLLSIVASILAKIGGDEIDLAKTIFSALAFIVVWGTLFAYYWVDEHRK